MRPLTAALIAEKNELNQAHPWIFLYEIKVDPYVLHWFFTSYPANVEFGGYIYRPIPIQHGDWKEDTEGNLSEINVTLNILGMDAFKTIDSYEGLVDKEVVIRLVNSNALGDEDAVIEEVYLITGAQGDQTAVTFDLGHYNFIQQKFPRQRYDRIHCRFSYKSEGCGYSGAMASCSKRLTGANGCEAHDNIYRFGGFPGIRR